MDKFVPQTFNDTQKTIQSIVDIIAPEQKQINADLSNKTEKMFVQYNESPATVILDIDGTLFRHDGNATKQMLCKKPKVLPGVLKKLEEWDRKGFRIILLTGRRESCRRITEDQLRDSGIFYDALVMGVGPGKRYLINDRKPKSEINTANAINISRNAGIKDVFI